MGKIFFILCSIAAFASLQLYASLASDIDNLFAAIQSSVDDSHFNEVNTIIMPYKALPAEKKLLLSATKLINGVAQTTPLHAAVQGNNYRLTALIIQKASVGAKAQYPAFSKELANACDAAGKKPIDYTTNREILNYLNIFTLSSIVCPSII